MKTAKMKIDYWGLAFLVIGLGCLQIVLDKGQREDWFSSSFIIWMSIVSSVSLVLFVITELFAEYPVVNLRSFKNISFSTGNLVMFFAFFNLFGSIVLLPIYLQTLMGYTSFLSGLVLGPGGVSTIFSLLIAGRLVTKVNPKGLLAFGIVISAYATHLMSQFNLYAGFSTIIWPRLVLGIGMGFLFIPLTTLTFATIKKEAMGNATAIFNLLRNLGGSFGVAFVTTILSRREQFHQFQLTEHLTPFDIPFQIASQQGTQILQYRGFESVLSRYGGLGVIYKELLRQASMMSFNDAFRLTSLLMISILPLVLFMKRRKESAQ
jgi:DHA2 family multidrug resistance protein